MAHLWAIDDIGQWAVFPLAGAAAGVVLTGDAARPVAAAGKELPSRGKALLAPAGQAGNEDAEWVLVASPDAVRVNDGALALGLRVLQDRDMLSIGGAPPLFFSKETLPRIEPFPGADHPVICPRCRRPIAREEPAVRCPRCKVWYHQIEGDPEDAYPCWTYGETCMSDSQATDLNAGYQWTPEALWHVA